MNVFNYNYSEWKDEALQLMRTMHSGELKKTESGLVYVKLPDSLLQEIFEVFKIAKTNNASLKNKDTNVDLPPFFPGQQGAFPNPIGAHISVINTFEYKSCDRQKLDKLLKILSSVSFRVIQLKSGPPDNWNSVEKIWFFQVASLTLENLRKWVGLPSDRNGKPLNITFAIRKRLSPMPIDLSLNKKIEITPLTCNPQNYSVDEREASLARLNRRWEAIMLAIEELKTDLQSKFKPLLARGVITLQDGERPIFYVKLDNQTLVNFFNSFSEKFQAIKISHKKRDSRYQLPPYYDTDVFDNPIGAHISLIGTHEWNTNSLNRRRVESYIGKEVSITLTDIKKIHPTRWNVMKSLWIATFKSDELMKIRESLELTPLPQETHEFHVTVAAKKHF